MPQDILIKLEPHVVHAQKETLVKTISVVSIKQNKNAAIKAKTLILDPVFPAFTEDSFGWGECTKPFSEQQKTFAPTRRP